MSKKNYLYYISILVVLTTLLTSCVQTAFVGAGGTVAALSGDRDASERLLDAKIATKIKFKLFKDHFKELYSNLDIKVYQRQVLFVGKIGHEVDAIRAMQVAWDIAEVKNVYNGMVVDKDHKHFDLGQYTKDSMITAQIKGKIIYTKYLRSANFSVITVKNVVYLFGVARSDEQVKQVTNIAANVSGVEKVESYISINENFNGKVNSAKSKKYNKKKNHDNNAGYDDSLIDYENQNIYDDDALYIQNK